MKLIIGQLTVLLLAAAHLWCQLVGSAAAAGVVSGSGQSVGLEPIDENGSVKKRNNDDDHTYGVIVDCGSSGTRAHIYMWDTKLDYPELLHDIGPMMEEDKAANKKNDEAVNKKYKAVNKKFEPSLSTLADKSLEQRHQYIRKVAEYIKSKIPSSRYAFTVVYLMATAGMRLLDEEVQDKIMEDIRRYLKDNYNFRDVTTSVISGTEEGMYRWISVNAKAKRFLNEKTDGRTKTYGVIEMGGASVQVVYQLKPGKVGLISKRLAGHGKNLKSIFLGQIVEPQISRRDKPENEYRLHSTTFLGFGGDSAHQAYLDLLIHNQFTRDYMKRFLQASALKAKQAWFDLFHCFACKSHIVNESKLLTIKDPCAPKGFQDEFQKPTRMLHTKDQTIGFIVDEDDEKQSATFPIRVIGTGNYNQCRKMVERMLWTAKKERLNCKRKNELAKSETDLCTMELLGERFVPFESMDFIGIGDFYHSTNTMLELAGPYRRDPIKAKTKEICNSSLDDLQQTYEDIAYNKNAKVAERIHQECFRAVWVDTFLFKGLRMDPDYKHFKTLREISEDDPEWTWGAVVDKSLAIEEATERTVATTGSNAAEHVDSTPSSK